MSKKMLIDATHSEETRVVVAQGSRIEEFDYESANKRQLRGNIYLAKITRVEPSLQAAFVEYGGNRHGFLAFSEIHPDYYQIPVADREALAAALAEDVRRDASLEENDFGGDDDNGSDDSDPTAEEDPAVWAAAAERAGKPATAEDDEIWGLALARSIEQGDADDPVVEIKTSKASSDDAEEGRPRRRRSPRRYKIQEVIKRRQILLVQVTKEERGNKGAALTTYMSLAGRYSVLMPNTGRGGGISRKIANVSDRKRLKSAVSELSVPEGMGLIIRTAGAERNKSEIKRDYEYLLRLWESVRDLTLESSAPSLVYEEGSLIKRSIRDLYNNEIDAVLVEGEDGYKEAKAFMKMLIPSHAKNVKAYRDPTPLYQRYKIETQLESMFNPTVQLKSGGYLVINPTEALVSIDVNSGRATREHSIEETAYKTNMEAAEEVARQFRLRDLAGLIVIDFIDMEEHRHNRAVERRLKDSLKSERARIQVGRISSFGLLEMSRQRMRSGLHEGSTITCPHCEGTGLVKSIESSALSCLRAIEEEGIRARSASCTLKAPNTVALYLLNQKRSELTRIEQTYLLNVIVEVDNQILSNDFELARGDALSAQQSETVEQTVSMETGYVGPDEVDEPSSTAEEVVLDSTSEGDDEKQPRKRRRRRRRGGRRPDENDVENANGEVTASEVADSEAAETKSEDEEVQSSNDNPNSGDNIDSGDSDEERPKRKRRRGRRGGKRNRRNGQSEETTTEDTDGEASEADPIVIEIVETEPVSETEVSDAPITNGSESVDEAELDEALVATEASEAAVIEPLQEDVPEAIPAQSSEPAKRGWWQKRSG
jgi:ribonuclease E